MVVVVTDGRDENAASNGPGSHRSWDNASRRWHAADTTVYVIGIGVRVDRERLEQLAAVTGGEAYFTTDVTELEQNYRRIVEELHRRYVLGLHVDQRQTRRLVAQGGDYDVDGWRALAEPRRLFRARTRRSRRDEVNGDLNLSGTPMASAFGTRAGSLPAAHRRTFVALFAITLFASSALMFVVEPLFGKLVLPRLGGSPSVWNTFVVFYQAVLLAGYLYTHLLTSRRPSRPDPAARRPACRRVAHAARGCSRQVDAAGRRLADSVAAGGARHRCRCAAAGTVGHCSSRAAMVLAYDSPFCRRPLSFVRRQQRGEHSRSARLPDRDRADGIAAIAEYVLECRVRSARGDDSHMWRRRHAPAARSAGRNANGRRDATDGVVGTPRQMIGLAFVPSSLMLAVTTYASTDIASVPLLWTVPLAVYLLTFVYAFAANRPRASRRGHAAMVMLTLPIAVAIALGAASPVWLMLPLHLALLLAFALTLHGELADDRPGPQHLTDFYLCLAAGGVLGGLFNTVLAPMLFTSVAEYPIAIALAWLLRRRTDRTRNHLQSHRSAVPVDDGDCGGGADALPQRGAAAGDNPSAHSRRADRRLSRVRQTLDATGGLRALHRPGRRVCTPTAARPAPVRPPHLLRDPSCVERSRQSGTQTNARHDRAWQPEHRGGVPRRTPGLLSPVRPNRSGVSRLGTVAAERQYRRRGLGAGDLAAYAKPGQRWMFYEIDPEVERIARDTTFFTYLRDCGDACHVLLGDARLSLERNPAPGYRILIIDAFSSDAIPVHLLTREALDLYLSRISADGLLAFHVSNRHLDLKPVLARLALERHLVAMAQLYRSGTQDEAQTASEWVLLARSQATLGALAADARWTRLTSSALSGCGPMISPTSSAC